VQFFFEDMPGAAIENLPGSAEGMKEPDQTEYVMGFVSSAEGLQLNTAFSKIGNVETRRKLVDLVKTLVD